MRFVAHGSRITNVSTHSRPKAADAGVADNFKQLVMFQHTAARRRLSLSGQDKLTLNKVSTHSRPKAADG